MKQININSLSQYMDYIQTNCSLDNLFRGIHNVTYKLIPKIGRCEYCKKLTGSSKEILNKLQDLEEQTMANFIRMSIPYNDLRKMSSFDQWTTGQHYGLPTRFLDWTENPLIAAYFATEGKITNDVAIYTIDRNQINTSIDLDDPFSSPNDVFIHIPSYINPRIIAQKGAFTVHKDPRKPLDETEVREGTLCTVTQFVISQNCIEDFQNNLDWCGINCSFIYPGLDGLANYLDLKAHK